MRSGIWKLPNLVMVFAIGYYLYNLKRKKQPWRSATLSKFAGFYFKGVFHVF